MRSSPGMLPSSSFIITELPPHLYWNSFNSWLLELHSAPFPFSRTPQFVGLLLYSLPCYYYILSPLAACVKFRLLVLARILKPPGCGAVLNTSIQPLVSLHSAMNWLVGPVCSSSCLPNREVTFSLYSQQHSHSSSSLVSWKQVPHVPLFPLNQINSNCCKKKISSTSLCSSFNFTPHLHQPSMIMTIELP